jgi:hypothetical protein
MDSKAKLLMLVSLDLSTYSFHISRSLIPRAIHHLVYHIRLYPHGRIGREQRLQAYGIGEV